MDYHVDTRSDATLVSLVLAGERETFAPLLLRYYQSVARLCRRLLGPTLEAQDIAQEAALQAFLRLGELHEPARFGAWLHAIAANLARMELRRRRLLSLDALHDGGILTNGRAAMIVLWAAGPHTPEEVHTAREVHDTIVAALSELSLVNREVVIGFYLEGYSYAELAELLGVPVSTVKGRLFKGRRQLQRALAPTAQEVLKPDRRPKKEYLMEAPELVEVEIESIRKSLLTHHRVVVLRAKSNGWVMPIWIGPFEADAIALTIEGRQPNRPMTHDLTLRLIAPAGGQVQRVVVTHITAQTFFAEIDLDVGGQTHTIDARPSDAIALAVRANAPIYVTQTLLETAGAASDEEWFKRHAADEAAAEQQPVEREWALVFATGIGTEAQRFVPLVEFTRADWPSSADLRDIEWEGRKMMAVRVPGSDDRETWLLVKPNFWEQLTTVTLKPESSPPQPPAAGAEQGESSHT
jgi:RNA polymerase sigma factor (sigma-70 family)